jgi:hypothetical protein
MRAVNLRTRLAAPEVRGKLLSHNAGQLGSIPARLDEQRVHIGKRLDAPFDGSFKTVGRVGMRKIYGRLDSCKDILGSVLGFPSKHNDVLVVTLFRPVMSLASAGRNNPSRSSAETCNSA